MYKKLFWVTAFFAVSACTVTGCAADTGEDDDDPIAESEDRLLAGRRLTPAAVATHLRNAGFPNSIVNKLTCSAKYESNYYERALNNRTRNGTKDYGLFQINSVHLRGETPGCPSSVEALYSAANNAKCAYGIWKQREDNRAGSGISAWYGYTSHRRECDAYVAPAGGGGGGSVPTPEPRPDAGGTQGAEDEEDTGPGGCWSGTLQDTVDAKACVQSKFDGVWFQCMNGKWYRGVSGNSGPYGACSSKHAL